MNVQVLDRRLGKACVEASEKLAKRSLGKVLFGK